MSSIADDIIKSLEQAVEIKKGNLQGNVTRYEIADVKAIREQLHVTQKELAMAIDDSVDTVKSWEQGRRNPTGLASKVLTLLSKEPELYSKFKENV